MIKAILFDLDGVLIDSRELHYDALNKALVDYKFPNITKEDHLSKFDGKSTKEKLDLLGINWELKNKISEAKQRYTAEFIEQINVDPEKAAILGYLHNDYKIGVVSNSIRKTINRTLLALGLRPHVDWVVSNEDVHRTKPAAEGYLRACIELEVDPKEALIVEDSPIGREAAAASGCHVFHVSSASGWTKEMLLDELTRINQIKTKPATWKAKKMNIVIPMSGAGSRFEQAGYTFPKPLVEIKGKPMIQVVKENLNIDAHYIFIVQKSHVEKYHLKTMLNLIAPGCSIVEINGLTEGAAVSVLNARKLIDNDTSLLIANSDQFLEWDASDFMWAMEGSSIVDVGVATFESTHPKWSYVKGEPWITEVAEKNPISTHATCGIYWWKRGSDFVTAADAMITKNIRTNGEFYVAPVINQSIGFGAKVKQYSVKAMWGLGTPEDLKYFLEHYSGNIL